MPLLHKDLILTLALTPVSRGVLAGSNPQLRVADTLPLTPSVEEWRAELGAHPATAHACTKWHNTERSGVFQNPPTPSSQLRPVPKQPSSGLRRQRGRKPKVATPGSLQPWNTERRTLRARPGPQTGCTLLKKVPDSKALKLALLGQALGNVLPRAKGAWPLYQESLSWL